MDFKEGDVIYVKEDEQYLVYKILVIDEYETYHVLMYKPDSHLEPSEIFIYHSPFDKNAFKTS